MSEHAITFEQQAIALIAAELPITIAFLIEDEGVVCCRSSPEQPKTYDEIAGALQALLIPPSLPPAIITTGGIRRLACNGHVPHLNGYIVILAGEFLVSGKLDTWVHNVSEAWKQLVADHVSMLNSTGTVGDPKSCMEYLAARFSIDETNIWLMAEEAGEVIRGCGKIGRWGYDHVHQVTGESGMRLLEAEVGDFLAIVDIMVARGHFTAEALEAAKQSKLKRLEDWYEAPWAPAETEGITTPPSPTTHSAKELIESGYLAKVVLADTGLPSPPKGLRETSLDQSPRRLANKAYWKERADAIARKLFPFEGLPPASGLAAGIAQSCSHVSSPEPTEECDPVEELPRTPEGHLDWKALDGDLTTVKKDADGLLTVEVTKNGRMRVFAGIVASPITINIKPTH
jgi:hypothetical protein